MKKNFFKRITAAVLAATMAVTSVSASAEIADTTLEGYLSAHANGGTYMLMDPNYEGYRGVYSGNIGFTYSSAIGNYTWIDSICSV
ncbi:MAG: hypothetical protein IJ416_08570 [Ruminiclostridium sp.]|nr:hypothetical protein [Ruminiclostridium sp.]